jgi:hypothetical protein
MNNELLHSSVPGIDSLPRCAAGPKIHTPPETYLVSPTPSLWKFEIPAHGSVAGFSSWTEKDYVMAGHCCHAAEICAEEKNKVAE